ncbi:oligosaccharyl transferase delta subunit [Gloeophyllum trabeum ATCC 11539]|uniref:Oligosaccharyl transferase delta subunit n=1 Tax=Gloeophyllum trabeum (strain ATCC 11539 / FP-39264 / Madison 617) TaxID=670483 RepID=S7PX91_GLOTA|nr:oligosaccharyl transferase delta subunit [Gloeophyllum trabeum ATCC 11539]EPQ52216.1 oligosaccharyl transferase delta subunit [Gloeophyllum trabeum ATCC 11539]
MHLSTLLLPLAAAAAVHASALTVQNARVTVSSDATQLLTEQLSLDGTLPSLSLGPTDTLKLTFQVAEKDGGKGVQPHQTFLRFESGGEEGVQPVRVTAGGKAKFELNMAKPPSSLPPTTTEPVKVQLLLGSFKHSPSKFDLFELTVPASAPPAQHPDEASFHPLPPIEHTFRPEQKVPPKFVSAVFSALVVAPWVVLLGLWSTLQYRVPHLFSPHILPFTSSLAAFEALLLWYWVDLKLGQVLLYGAILGVVTAVTGKQALGAAGDWRLGKR